jgi:hypothetical protein
MVRIRPTEGSGDYLNLNEIELFDSGGAQLPSSSLTLFMSTYYEEEGLPSARQEPLAHLSTALGVLLFFPMQQASQHAVVC